MDETIARTLASYGLAGVVISFLLWLMRHVTTDLWPKTLQVFREEQAAERAMCKEQHVELVRALNDQHEKNMAAHEKTVERLHGLEQAVAIRRLAGEIKTRRDDRGDAT